MIAAAAMSLSSVSVIVNAARLRTRTAMIAEGRHGLCSFWRTIAEAEMWPGMRAAPSPAVPHEAGKSDAGDELRRQSSVDAETHDREQAIQDAKSAILNKMTLVRRQGSRLRHRARLVRRHRAGRARPRRHPVSSPASASSKADGKKRVYYLSLEFLIGRQLTDVLSQSRLIEHIPRGARRSRRRHRQGARRASRMRRSAMAASAGSRPASWKAWRRSASRPMATASATTTACSGRSSRTAGSRNSRRTGCPSARRGNSSART